MVRYVCQCVHYNELKAVSQLLLNLGNIGFYHTMCFFYLTNAQIS